MNAILAGLLILFSAAANAQTTKSAVLTLGTFHFNFPNLDVQQVSKTGQIDVLEPQYQKEIEKIVRKISRFKPTMIVIERQPSDQARTDSLYQAYLRGTYQLKRTEEEQLGFRLAKQLGLKTLHCIDEWGNFTQQMEGIVYGKNKAEAEKFEAYFEASPDAEKRFAPLPVYKTNGILAALKQENDEQNLKKSLGNYLIGMFKYESEARDFAGVDFETGRWFSRNLKIFRNIQRLNPTPTDRILVIYGAGHLNLLNHFFDCSPEFHRVKTSKYL